MFAKTKKVRAYHVIMCCKDLLELRVSDTLRGVQEETKLMAEGMAFVLVP